MGILCPVILPATRVVPPRNTKFAQRRAVGSELVGHDGGWSDALLLQEFSHQLERRLAVSPWLNEDVEHDAVLIDGTPQIMLHSLDPDEHLIDVPLVPGSWSAAAKAFCEGLAKLLAPPTNRLIGDDDATFSQKQLNIS